MNEFDNGKTVLITGAAGGLGKAFAAECASRGWNLLLVDVNREALPPLQSGLTRLFGIRVDTIACDLTNSTARDSLWEQERKTFSQLHGLINVAGLEYEGPFRQRSAEELRTIIRLNIEATVENTHQVVSLLDTSQNAFIINVSSLASAFPMPVKAVYAASKRFILNFTRALHHELKQEGIRVLALCPAGLPTHRAALQRIQSQGLLGQLTTMNVGRVAARSLDLALAGRSLYIPGLINRLIFSLQSVVPPDIAAGYIQRRFLRALEDRRRLGLTENTTLVQKGAAHSAEKLIGPGEKGIA